MRAFPYYGSKTRLGRLYPKPVHDVIVEPFAGAAAYSQLYWENSVRLSDLSKSVVDCWSFLIAATADDIMRLPLVEPGLDLETITTLSDGERALLQFFAYDGFAGVSGRRIGKRCIWNSYREPLSKIVHRFSHWTIARMSYDNLPNEEATWFIDPPYQFGGEHYDCPNTDIDFEQLADWCMRRKGQRIVCENTKATWLPFKPLAMLSGLKHTTIEAIFAPDEKLPDLELVFEHERAIIIHGDSSRLEDVLEPNSVDSIVADPPAGIDFMSKGWDGDKGGRDSWIAWLRDLMIPSFRALKPGGHALVWALPRTSHWTATALEDAGFEIRDLVMHIFATGFPKSLDISKAIDDHFGLEREQIGERKGTGNTSFAGESDGKGLGPTIAVTAPACDESKAWEGWGTALKPAAEHWILCRKPVEGSNVAANVLAFGTGGINIDGCRVGTEQTETNRNGNSGAYGVYGRDERVGTIEHAAPGRWPAHLTLEHAPECVAIGVAAETRDVMVRTSTVVAASSMAGESTGATPSGETFENHHEVFACVPGCPVRMLDDQSGIAKPQKPRNAMTPQDESQPVQFMRGTIKHQFTPADFGGGASRFFFVAKPPRSEKDAGLRHLPKRGGGEATGRKEGSKGTQNPRAGGGRTGGAHNIHPTPKPIALMRWLVRLITPPGGVVLDPFAGSGTTGVAALAEGMSFVGCELGGEDGEYLPILVGRIRHALGIGVDDEFDVSDVSDGTGDAEDHPLAPLEAGVDDPKNVLPESG